MHLTAAPHFDSFRRFSDEAVINHFRRRKIKSNYWKTLVGASSKRNKVKVSEMAWEKVVKNWKEKVSRCKVFFFLNICHTQLHTNTHPFPYIERCVANYSHINTHNIQCCCVCTTKRREKKTRNEGKNAKYGSLKMVIRHMVSRKILVKLIKITKADCVW